MKNESLCLLYVLTSLHSSLLSKTNTTCRDVPEKISFFLSLFLSFLLNILPRGRNHTRCSSSHRFVSTATSKSFKPDCQVPREILKQREPYFRRPSHDRKIGFPSASRAQATLVLCFFVLKDNAGQSGTSTSDADYGTIYFSCDLCAADWPACEADRVPSKTPS